MTMQEVNVAVKLIQERACPTFSLRDVEDWDPDESYVELPEPEDDDNWGEPQKRYVFADSMFEMNSCCGIGELNQLNLSSLDDVGIALFSLWLRKQQFQHNPPAAILATTAFKNRAGLNKTEKVLKEVGFVPVMRGVNGNTDNHVTLWVYQVAPSTLHPARKGVKRVKTSSKANSRTGRR